jgi:hypothetical protein
LTDLVREDVRAGALALDGRWGYALGVYQELWRRHQEGELRFTRALSQLGAAAAAPEWSPAVAAIAADARTAFEACGAFAFIRQVDELVARRSAEVSAAALAEPEETTSTVSG